MTNLPTHLATKSVSGAGSGLFTPQAIEPGVEVFHVDRPLVSVLNSGHLKTACSNCFLWLPDNGGDGGTVVQMETGIADAKKLKACQACKIVRYCSQVGFWSPVTRHYDIFQHAESHYSPYHQILDGFSGALFTLYQIPFVVYNNSHFKRHLELPFTFYCFRPSAHPLSRPFTGLSSSIMESPPQIRMQDFRKVLPKRPPQYRPHSDATSPPQKSQCPP